MRLQTCAVGVGSVSLGVHDRSPGRRRQQSLGGIRHLGGRQVWKSRCDAEARNGGSIGAATSSGCTAASTITRDASIHSFDVRVCNGVSDREHVWQQLQSFLARRPLANRVAQRLRILASLQRTAPRRESTVLVDGNGRPVPQPHGQQSPANEARMPGPRVTELLRRYLASQRPIVRFRDASIAAAHGFSEHLLFVRVDDGKRVDGRVTRRCRGALDGRCRSRGAR